MTCEIDMKLKIHVHEVLLEHSPAHSSTDYATMGAAETDVSQSKLFVTWPVIESLLTLVLLENHC